MTARVRHDDFLRRLSTGDLDPGSDEARRHFGECQSCRERWHAMARLIEELEAADVERREVLLLASEPTARDIERSQRAAVAAGIGAPPAHSSDATSQQSARGPRRTMLVVLAAAAALFAAFFVVRAWTADHPRRDLGTMLGSGDHRILDADSVLDTDGVTIDYPLGPMCGFDIELDGWSNGVSVSAREKIWEPRWRPDPALLRRFEGKVMLRVQPFIAGGQPDGPPFEREFSLSR